MHPCLKNLRTGDIVYSSENASGNRRKEIAWAITVRYEEGERNVYFSSPLMYRFRLDEDAFLDEHIIKIVKAPK